jgi:hypothetical protein
MTMARVAIFDEADKTIVAFKDEAGVPADAKRRPVVEEKPVVQPGHELFGPNYRIERDRVVAIWKNVPVDPTRPEIMAAKIADLETRLAKLEGIPSPISPR